MSRAGPTARQGPAPGPAADGLIAVTPGGPDVLPATLAAIAEAAVLFLPARTMLSQFEQATGGPLFVFPLFVAVFAAGVGLATRFRHLRQVPPLTALAAAALGLLQGTAWSPSPSLEGVIFAIIISLALATRVIALAFRDWRNPMKASFLVGALALLGEVLVGGDAASGWGPIATAAVPIFFGGALASRAASVRLSSEAPAGSEDLSAAERAHAESSARMAMLMILGLGVVFGLALLLSRSGDTLGLIGRYMTDLVSFVLGIGVFIASQAFHALVWVFSHVHIHFAGTGHRSLPTPVQTGLHHPPRLKPPSAAQGELRRLIGLGVLAGVAALLYWGVRRRRTTLVERSRSAFDEEAVSGVERLERPERPPRTAGRWRRAALSADTIRRWYGEVLLALERRGLSRVPSLTPGEFAAAVAAAFPEASEPFARLTSAYEHVRYGLERVEPAAGEGLADDRARLLDGLRRWRRADGGDGADGG